MAYTNPVISKSQNEAPSSGKRGQSVELARILGSYADEELQRPMCVTCSTQTSYAGSDLQAESEDSDYKW